jgi:radical SAM protein
VDVVPSPIRHAHFDVSERPFLVIWEVTRSCALACRHCRAEARPDRDSLELTRAEARDLFAEIKAFGDPPPLLVLTGGDPLGRPDLFDLVADAREAGLAVSLSPSVTPLVTAEALDQIKESGVHVVALSLDGDTAATHDAFRATPGVFDATLKTWADARDRGLRVQVNTTVTRHNVRELPGVLRMVQELGAMTWSVFFLVPTGRGLRDDAMDAAEAEDVLNFLYDAGHLVSVKATEAHHYRRVALQRVECERRGVDPVTELGLGRTYRQLREQLDSLPASPSAASAPFGVRRPPLQISAGSGFAFVSHVGDVYPSGFLPIPGGNVRLESLRTIYRESKIFVDIRDADRLGGRCGRCEFRSVCGGSRARAFAMTGDVMAEEPLCSYEPGSFAWSDAAPMLAEVR